MGLTYVNQGTSVSCTAANGRNFPWLVRDYIEDNYMDIFFLNKAVSGLECSAVATLKSTICEFDAELVTVELGMNDISAGSTDDFKSQLGSIVDYFRDRNPDVNIILCTMSGIDITNRVENIGRFRTAVEEVAAEKNTYLCKFHEYLTDEMADQDLWNETEAGTKLHPNEAGHVYLGQALEPIIDEILG